MSFLMSPKYLALIYYYWSEKLFKGERRYCQGFAFNLGCVGFRSEILQFYMTYIQIQYFLLPDWWTRYNWNVIYGGNRLSIIILFFYWKTRQLWSREEQKLIYIIVSGFILFVGKLLRKIVIEILEKVFYFNS